MKNLKLVKLEGKENIYCVRYFEKPSIFKTVMTIYSNKEVYQLSIELAEYLSNINDNEDYIIEIEDIK